MLYKSHMNKPRVNIYWQLFQYALSVKHDFMEIAERYDLSVMQLYTLSLLGVNESIPMNSLSNMLHCDASNITGIVDRLFQHKYIMRKENPKDRREKMLTLTQKGQKIYEKISQEINAYRPKNIHKLTVLQVQHLTQLLARLLTLNSPSTQ